MCSDDASNKPSNNNFLLRREKREYLKQILDAVQEELDRCKEELKESE
jgi:hypothetical protein